MDAMTSAEYPLLTIPSYELYQLAHIATFIADAMARYRAAGRGRQGREERAEAIRDIGGGWAALDTATGATTPTPTGQLPQPIDMPTFKVARELASQGPRSADVVSLAPTGLTGWAVVGHVPGLGPVGARVATRTLADALRHHLLTQPAAALAPWAVTGPATPIGNIPEQVDLAAFVNNLDPGQLDARAVARHLRGIDRRTDAAIRTRFAGIDLDAPLVAAPPTSGSGTGTQPAQQPTSATPSRFGPQAKATRPPSAPATNAGP
jgi:hypothetical protein